MRHSLRMISMALAGIAFCAETPAPQKTIMINPAYRNLGLLPGDDFEEYANGGWRKTAEIPADRSSSGATFEVFQRGEQRTAELIHEIAAGRPETGTPREMIASYYTAFMDAANIEKHGLEPLKEKLRQIEKIESKGDLARTLGKRLRTDVDPLNATDLWSENLFGLWVAQALSEPDRTVPYLLQGGLGMRDREYYLSDKPEMAKLRTAYQSYVGELLKLAGKSDAAGCAERIMALEKKMAAVHADLIASQDVHKANNPATIADLKSNAPGLDWPAYLEAAGLGKQPMFIIWQPARSKVCPPWLRASLSRLGKNGWHSTPSTVTPSIFPKSMTISISAFMEGHSRESHNSLSVGSAPSPASTAISATRSVKFMSRNISHLLRRPRWRIWLTIFSPLLIVASTA